MSQLDHYSDQLMKVFKKKGGTAEHKISPIMAAMDKVGRLNGVVWALDPVSPYLLLYPAYLCKSLPVSHCFTSLPQFGFSSLILFLYLAKIVYGLWKHGILHIMYRL